jgi:hypothetical protein
VDNRLLAATRQPRFEPRSDLKFQSAEVRKNKGTFFVAKPVILHLHKHDLEGNKLAEVWADVSLIPIHQVGPPRESENVDTAPFACAAVFFVVFGTQIRKNQFAWQDSWFVLRYLSSLFFNMEQGTKENVLWWMVNNGWRERCRTVQLLAMGYETPLYYPLFDQENYGNPKFIRFVLEFGAVSYAVTSDGWTTVRERASTIVSPGIYVGEKETLACKQGLMVPAFDIDYEFKLFSRFGLNVLEAVRIYTKTMEFDYAYKAFELQLRHTLFNLDALALGSILESGLPQT